MGGCNVPGGPVYPSGQSSSESDRNAQSAGSGRASEVVRAVRAGDRTRLQHLLREGRDVNAMDARTGKTPLHAAIERSDLQSIEMLLAHGADSFHCYGSYPSAVEFLLHSVLVDQTGEYSSQWASDMKCTILSSFIKAGAPPNLMVGHAPLIVWAVTEGWTGVLQLLIANGVDLEKRDRDNWTALAHAVALRKRSVVAALIEAGAEPSVPVGKAGAIFTPIALARARSDILMLALLGQAGNVR